MKLSNLLFLLSFLGFVNLSAQNSCQPPIYYFNSKTNVSGNGGNGSVYRFNSVLSGIDAIVTVTRIQNAQVNNTNMDNSSGYSVAWQPFITFPSSRNNASDSSYVEYRVDFVNSGTSNLLVQNCMSLSIVDLDGSGSSNSYREMLKIALPGTPMGIDNSSISVYEDSRWVLFKSGISQFNSIDTANAAAMGQMNFPAGTNSFKIRIGVVGPVSGGTQRQFSLYFKSFAALTVPLPVYLSDFTGAHLDGTNIIQWKSTHESGFSHFELYRSYNGLNFELIDRINGQGNISAVNHYYYQDQEFNRESDQQYFYKLRMVDLNNNASWSHSIAVNNKQKVPGEISIYPNPAQNLISLSGTGINQANEIRLMDIFGRTLINVPVSEIENLYSLNITDLNPGIYTILIVNFDGTTISKQIVKE